MNPVRRSFPSNASWLWLALAVVAGTSPTLHAAPPNGSDPRGAEFFESLLIKAVRYKDEVLRMPLDGKKLTGAQVADLEAWVKMGAPLPGAGVQEDKIKASSRTHWAFQPVKRPAIPTVKNERWVQSPVDAFILAKLESTGMQP